MEESHGVRCGIANEFRGMAEVFIKSTELTLWRLRVQDPRILLLDSDAMPFPPMMMATLEHYGARGFLPEFSIRIAQMALLHSRKRAPTARRSDGLVARCAN